MNVFLSAEGGEQFEEWVKSEEILLCLKCSSQSLILTEVVWCNPWHYLQQILKCCACVCAALEILSSSVIKPQR